MKADKFVFQHLDFLDTKIALASNEKDISVTNNIPLQIDKDIESMKSQTIANHSKNREPSLEKSVDSMDISKKNDDVESVDSMDISKKNDDVESVDSIDILMKNDDIEYKTDDKDSTGKLNLSNVSHVNEKNCSWNTCENWYGLANPTNNISEPDVNKCSQELPKSK
ncbi:kda protein in nof-fb transposable element [Lasius niger]|uniref:KDa protein in nof-fb transposable element n=1 Tax=Lasius niger TaxID=67767 RepID=A0A0J7KIM2_LASNI|nr:kda protein in nof-fb transposable element [Lasius niger]